MAMLVEYLIVGGVAESPRQVKRACRDRHPVRFIVLVTVGRSTTSRAENGSGHKEGRPHFSSLSGNYFETSVEDNLYVRREESLPFVGSWCLTYPPRRVLGNSRGGSNCGLAAFPRCVLYPCTLPVRLLQRSCSLHNMGVTGSQVHSNPKGALCRQGHGRGSRKGSLRGTVTPPTRLPQSPYWPAKAARTLYHPRFVCTRKLDASGVKAV